MCFPSARTGFVVARHQSEIAWLELATNFGEAFLSSLLEKRRKAPGSIASANGEPPAVRITQLSSVSIGQD